MRKKGIRRIFAALLPVVLFAGLLLPGAAEETVFFTAINNTLQELSADTMPTTYNSMIYVPFSVFNSDELGTHSFYSKSSQMALVSDGSATLYFDMSTGTGYDDGGTTYRYEAIYQNGTAYLPAYFTARYFGLSYSYIRQDGWHIVRLTKGSVLSDKEFFSAAASLMESRLREYQKSREPVPTETPAPTPSATPTPEPSPTPTPEPSPSPSPDPEKPDRSGVTVHLMFLGIGEGTERLAETLTRRGLPAAFFADAEEIRQNGDLVRSLLGTGFTLGAYLDADAADAYEDFSDALADAALTVSFLACTEEETAENAGILVCARETDLAGSFNDCAVRLEAADDRCDLLLPGDFSGLDSLIWLLQRDGYRVEGVNELTGGGIE